MADLWFLSSKLGKNHASTKVFLAQKTYASILFTTDLLVSTISRIISEHLIQGHRVGANTWILNLGIRGVPWSSLSVIAS